MDLIATPIRHHIGARDIAPLTIGQDAASAYREFANIGIDIQPSHLALMLANRNTAAAMDADVQSNVSAASIITQVQFLQAFLPGQVAVTTKVRKIDELIGVTTIGDWMDQQIVQQFLEHSGEAQEYSDESNIPLSNWNSNWETRQIVRFEEGINVGILEAARSSRANVDSASQKRAAAQNALDILRNRVGFFGYSNVSLTQIYGFLNDPSLPASVEVPNGGGGSSEWATKTFQEITLDIRTFVSALLVQSGGNVDAYSQPTTLSLGLSVGSSLSTTTDFGQSVQDWIDRTYRGNMRVVLAPEMDGAGPGGDNLGYLYSETVGGDPSTDGGATWVQMVPNRFRTLGVEQRAKSFVEDYSNALAGVMLKRPFAIYSAYGM